MDIELSSQKLTDNLSFIEPPGCMIDLIPFLYAISTQSGKGKNASLAITAPLRSKLNLFAFSIAWFNASTLDVWPVPDEISWLFFANTIVLDLVCLDIFDANNRSSISKSLGFNFVTNSKLSDESVIKSFSWNKFPFKHVLDELFLKFKFLSFKIILFFLDFSNSSAAESKLGARMTSKNKLFIFLEAFKSIFWFEIKTPPNAEIGSPSSAPS